MQIKPRQSSNLENKQYRKNLETIFKPGKQAIQKELRDNLQTWKTSNTERTKTIFKPGNQAIQIEPRQSSNLENKQ